MRNWLTNIPTIFTTCIQIWLAGICVGQEPATRIIDFSRPIQTFEWAPDGNSFVVMSNSNLMLFDANSGEMLFEYGMLYRTSSTRPTFLQFTSDGEQLVVVSNLDGIKVLAMSEDRQSIKENNHFRIDYKTQKFGLARDVPLIAAATNQSLLRIYNFETGEEVNEIDLSSFNENIVPKSVHISAKGGQILVAARHSVLLIDVEREEVIQTIRNNIVRNNEMFSVDGTQLIGIDGGQVAIFNLREGTSQKRKLGSRECQACWIDATNEIAIVENEELRIHDATSFEEIHRMAIETDGLKGWEGLSVSPDGSRIAMTLQDHVNKKFKLLTIDLPAER